MAASNEPVLANGGLALLLTLLAPLLVRWGIDADTLGQILYYAGAAVSAIVAVVRLFAARGKVTPLASPNLPATTAGGEF